MQKENFKIWLIEQGLSEVTANNYLRGIRYTEEKFAYLFGEGPINIYQISSDDIDVILRDEEFKAYDKKGNRMSSSGLKKYQEFLHTSLIIDEHVFRTWLEKNTSLSTGSLGTYLTAIRKLKKSFSYNDSEEFLDIYKIKDINKIDKVLKNQEFILMDKKWKNAFSAALNHYKNFLRALLNEDLETLDTKEDRDEFEARLFLDEFISSQKLISHIHQYISTKGFLYSKQNITNLYISLRTKPFVILSGISGTGKTKIVQLFANAVGANYENGRYRLISVRPNWSDSSDLLGYTDLKGDFVSGQLTDMIVRATNDPDHPYFVVLDEMNLARVEYYLSDYLSVIESRDRQGDEIVTAPIVEVQEEETEEKIPYGLPDNLYIIGTVNMDETTHPFSKKVLDRANSIEFNEIHLTAYDFFTNAAQVSSKNVSNKHFVSEYLYFNEIYQQHRELVQNVSEQLEQMNEQLKTIYAQVGYRVRDEICFYMVYAQDTDLTDDEAMDFCIMQKILPRISGAGTDMEKLLEALYKDFAGVAYAKDKEVPANAQYPRSAKKLAEMRKRLSSQGFTSFWAS